KTTPFAEFPGSERSWRSGRRPERVVSVAPKLVCECRYAAFTADGKVRHASFLGLRDRDPRECVFPVEARKEMEKAEADPSTPRSLRERSAQGDLKRKTGRARDERKRGNPSRRGPTSDHPGRSDGEAGAESKGPLLSNLDKVFWPDDGLTKGDLI